MDPDKEEVILKLIKFFHSYENHFPDVEHYELAQYYSKLIDEGKITIELKDDEISHITIIRNATIKDIEPIVKLIHNFYMEGLKECGMSFRIDTLIKTINMYVTEKQTIVAERDGELVGIISGNVAKSIFDEDQIIAQESMWYVNEENRKGKVGFKLLKEFEKQVKYLGASIVSMINLSAVNDDRMSRYYKRIGYNKVETHYLKEL